MFWAFAPKLKKTLQADCGTRTSAVKHAIACIEDLLGTNRPEVCMKNRVGYVLAWHRWERMGGSGVRVD